MQLTRVPKKEARRTFELDQRLEQVLAGLKPGDSYDLPLDSIKLETAIRHLDKMARQVLGKRLRFQYSDDGKVLRFLVTNDTATPFGRRTLGRRAPRNKAKKVTE